MLEHYYTRPATLDRIRSLGLGAPISRYAEWMSEQQVARASALFRLQTLVLFDRYVSARQVRALEALPAQLEPFIRHWRRTRGHRPHSASYDRSLRAGPRATLEQFLRLTVPGFVGRVRGAPWPLRDRAPGFLEHLREERGLRPETLAGYAHHLRVVERWLERAAITDLSSLTPALVGRLLLESTRRLAPGGRQGRAGALRVLLRYLHRQGILATDLARAVPRGRAYK